MPQGFITLSFTIMLLLLSPALAPAGPIEMDMSSGTGFFVTPRHVITNQHVVRSCQYIVVRGAVAPTVATMAATDDQMDLALLKVEQPSPRTAYLRSNPGLKAGDTLHIIGYPKNHAVTGQYLLKQARVIDPAFTFKGVTSVTFTNEVAHGNSGGPLLDYAGNVIGVVVGQLSYYEKDSNGIRANTPFKVIGVGIGLPILKQFLARNDVFITETSSYDLFGDPHPDQRAKDYTVNVLCLKRARAIN